MPISSTVFCTDIWHKHPDQTFKCAALVVYCYFRKKSAITSWMEEFSIKSLSSSPTFFSPTNPQKKSFSDFPFLPWNDVPVSHFCRKWEFPSSDQWFPINDGKSLIDDTQLDKNKPDRRVGEKVRNKKRCLAIARLKKRTRTNLENSMSVSNGMKQEITYFFLPRQNIQNITIAQMEIDRDS